MKNIKVHVRLYDHYLAVEFMGLGDSDVWRWLARLYYPLVEKDNNACIKLKEFIHHVNFRKEACFTFTGSNCSFSIKHNNADLDFIDYCVYSRANIDVCENNRHIWNALIREGFRVTKEELK